MKYKGMRGFTLIEILVVILVISILLGISLVTVSSSNSVRSIQDQGDLLTALFTQARDKALLENNVYGFSAGQGSYTWWKLQSKNKTWLSLIDKPFQPRILPEQISIQLIYDNTDSLVQEKTEEKPDIVIFADNQVSPFQLLLSNDQNEQLVITTDGLADVHIQEEL